MDRIIGMAFRTMCRRSKDFVQNVLTPVVTVKTAYDFVKEPSNSELKDELHDLSAKVKELGDQLVSCHSTLHQSDVKKCCNLTDGSGACWWESAWFLSLG